MLASPHYQAAARGLQRPSDSFLHISGMCVCRNASGAWEVKHHHFSHATGISYMMQNRRALARVLPELFQDTAVQSLAEMPLIIVERLRQTASTLGHEPTVVLLSPGAGSAVSSEQSFIARRMGIPVVAGGDLLVLGDGLYLKTVRGLERVDVVYNRVADVWLDPLVFRSDSVLGVPGLVHCLRKGTATLINPVGAQLADDRSLLGFAPQIIRFYLGEAPILPTVPTVWLGDIDQREMVLEDLGRFHIRPIVRDNSSGSWERALPSDETSLRGEIRKQASLFVAQPRHEGALTVCFEGGRQVEHPQDHILYAVRRGGDFEVFPGALTRVFKRHDSPGDFGFGWTSKDSWVLSDDTTAELLPRFSRRRPESGLPARQVTSRVAEAFYWMGRYLERAHHQAYLISVIETLESEELNSAERRHYRPMWNRLLPPLEKSAGTSRRSITTRLDRYRLVLAPEPGSVVSTYLRAVRNAESVQDSLSPEAWVTMSNLRSRFQRARFREDPPEHEAAKVTRRLSDFATQLIPQFFAVCANTMLADDAWRFCEIGQMLERAVITANSVSAVRDAWQPEGDGGDNHTT
ncbi:MAG TPA: circularly permuted type 2 ATP-grasp protein, partial [Gemmatimonadaceae bacterium]